jgi:aminoglycoside 6-adenylyltransferase
MTYPNFTAEGIWNSIFIMDSMFREIAGEVAGYFGYNYPKLDDERVTAYLKHIRNLSKDVQTIY